MTRPISAETRAECAEAVAATLLALDPCQGGEEQHSRHLDVCVPFHDRARPLLTDEVLDAMDRLRVSAS